MLDKTFRFRVDAETIRRLTALADALGTTPSMWLRIWVKQEYDRMKREGASRAPLSAPRGAL